MAKNTNYKQIKTGTVNLGTAGAQVHIASIDMIDDAIRGAFLNNVQFSVMQNGTIGSGTVNNTAPDDSKIATSGANAPARSTTMGFTFYLSYRSTAWDDDSVIAVYAVGGAAGNGNLTCKRSIKTNEEGSTVAEQLGPIHVWMEGTDISAVVDAEARVTLTAWGRMILLTEDF